MTSRGPRECEPPCPLVWCLGVTVLPGGAEEVDEPIVVEQSDYGWWGLSGIGCHPRRGDGCAFEAAAAHVRLDEMLPKCFLAPRKYLDESERWCVTPWKALRASSTCFLLSGSESALILGGPGDS